VRKGLNVSLWCNSLREERWNYSISTKNVGKPVKAVKTAEQLVFWASIWLRPFFHVRPLWSNSQCDGRKWERENSWGLKNWKRFALSYTQNHRNAYGNEKVKLPCQGSGGYHWQTYLGYALSLYISDCGDWLDLKINSHRAKTISLMKIRLFDRCLTWDSVANSDFTGQQWKIECKKSVAKLWEFLVLDSASDYLIEIHQYSEPHVNCYTSTLRQ
jgi:hypothetical protein